MYSHVGKCLQNTGTKVCSEIVTRCVKDHTFALLNFGTLPLGGFHIVKYCDLAFESPIGKVLYSRELIILKFNRSLYFETVQICFMRIFSPHSSADCKTVVTW